MLVSIGSYQICDGSLTGGVATGQARVQMDRVFDIVVPIEELNPEVFDRVCRKLTFAFIVQRTHANAAAAELFILDLDSNIPVPTADTTVKLTPTASVSYRYIPNGFVSNHQSQQNGATSTTTYTIVGGQPTAVAP